MQPLEYYNLPRVDLSAAAVDLEHLHRIGILLQDIQYGELRRCRSGNAHTDPRDGGEGHAFQLLDCRQRTKQGKLIARRLPKPALRLIACVAFASKPDEMEDMFSLFGTWNALLKDCMAIGPVNRTGSGLCIDRGCQYVTVQGGSYDGGVVVCDGVGHVLRGVTSPRLSVSNEWYKGNRRIEVHVERCRFEEFYIQDNPRVAVWIDGKRAEAREP